MLPSLLLMLIWVSRGLCEDEPPCRTQDDSLCRDLCTAYAKSCEGIDDCAFDVCGSVSELCPPRPSCVQLLYRCWGVFAGCSDESEAEDAQNQQKRAPTRGFAFLFLKLHPFFSRPNSQSMASSARYRRIGGRFGSEFLGKRMMDIPGEEYEDNDENNEREKKKASRKGKVREFLGKRNREFLGRKRGKEKYVYRGREFLGKRGEVDDEWIWQFPEVKNETASENIVESKRTKLYKGRKPGNEFLGKRIGFLTNVPESSTWSGNGEPEYPNFVNKIWDLPGRPKTELPARFIRGSEFLG